MKKLVRSTLALLLVLLFAFSCSACGKKEAAPAGLWDTATYKADAEIGEGKQTLNVVVKAEEKSVKFTVHTDEATVGAALLEQKLIDGEEGAYGLYVKAVNGITADYDVDQSYWAFYIDGEYAASGVDTTDITEGAEYQLVWTK